jgi:hypothetical protein
MNQISLDTQARRGVFEASHLGPIATLLKETIEELEASVQLVSDRLPVESRAKVS